MFIMKIKTTESITYVGLGMTPIFRSGDVLKLEYDDGNLPI